MTKSENSPSIGELLVTVEKMLIENPKSSKLKWASASLRMGARQERQIYALPIFGVAFTLLGAFLAISDGDWSVLAVFGGIGVLVALSFFPIRGVFRWELRRKARKIEKLAAKLAHKSP